MNIEVRRILAVLCIAALAAGNLGIGATEPASSGFKDQIGQFRNPPAPVQSQFTMRLDLQAGKMVVDPRTAAKLLATSAPACFAPASLVVSRWARGPVDDISAHFATSLVALYRLLLI